MSSGADVGTCRCWSDDGSVRPPSVPTENFLGGVKVRNFVVRQTTSGRYALEDAGDHLRLRWSADITVDAADVASV